MKILNRLLNNPQDEYNFSPQQWDILITLGENLHQLTDHTTLAQRVFGREPNSADNDTLRNQIKTIRKELPKNFLIRTLHTRGYMLTDSLRLFTEVDINTEIDTEDEF